MALQCPNCGAAIPAENINIQKTLALCSQCDLVFDFTDMVVARKAKPRKPPERLHIDEDDYRLELSYQRVFGPGPKFGLVMATFASFFLPLALIAIYSKGGPFPLLGVVSFLTCVFWYILAVFLTTTTRVTVDHETLEVRSGPLPFPLSDNKTVSLLDIKRVFCEDTLETWPGPSGMPAHHVSADLYDGDRITLLTSLPRNYAVYIAAALDAYIQSGDSGTLAAATSELDVDSEVMRLDYLSDEEDKSVNIGH